ncbi:MAG: hypothetical protein JNJ80_14045 [Gemmatimonadetes bacterium]|nr:hypothetical protein [Gemmatimonadota bacterium]
MIHSRATWPAWLLAAGLAGCSEGVGPEPGPPPPAAPVVQVAGGGGQKGVAGSELPVAIAVRVTQNGVVAASRPVTWEVASGDPTIVAATGTDGAGLATARVRLGSATVQTIRARVDGGSADIAIGAVPAGQDPVLVGEVGIPPTYGIHDTYVRDGIAFVCAWNAGVIIYDVGDGRRGGSPSFPVEISRLITADNGVPGGPAVHNAWWFHNPVSNEKRYLFIGQEGPASLFSTASGDLHVIDVSDLANPREVATLTIPGAGIHNFWMNEATQTLYAAYYNAGVVALDVSGTLSGNLTSRIKAQRAIGGAGNTFTWGVMLAGGSLWANDIVSGFWRLDPVTLQPIAGGNNVPERWGSDLWVTGTHGYSGTWGGTARGGTGFGDAIKIWSLAGGGPTLVDSLKIPNIRTVSDLEVSDDGNLLVVTTERLGGAGLYVYGLTDPAKPNLLGFRAVSTGLHTGTLARIGGRLYVFAAKNPTDPALQVYDITR